MDHLFYWLDHGSWLVPLRHSWVWATLTAVLAVASVMGIAALARRYDGGESKHGVADT